MNPDDSVTEVAFEKGFQLLAYIETLIGYENMEDFLTYFVYNDYMVSIDGFQVREIFREFLPTVANGNATWVNEVLSQIDWELWIYGVGPDPTMSLNFTTANNSEAVQLALDYIALNGSANPPNWQAYEYWPSPSQVLFHDTLLDNVPSGAMTEPIMQQIN
jgi:leukotriene-A4 hydrolase